MYNFHLVFNGADILSLTHFEAKRDYVKHLIFHWNVPRHFARTNRLSMRAHHAHTHRETEEHLNFDWTVADMVKNDEKVQATDRKNDGCYLPLHYFSLFSLLLLLFDKRKNAALNIAHTQTDRMYCVAYRIWATLFLCEQQKWAKIFEHCLLYVNQAICIHTAHIGVSFFLHVPYYEQAKCRRSSEKEITRTRKIINERAVLSTIQALILVGYFRFTQIHLMQCDRFH